MENPVFGFLPVIRSRTFDLIDRPVLLLRLNNETPIFPLVLYLQLAYKTIGTNHNNVSRLQGNSFCFAIIVMALSSYFFRGESPRHHEGFLQPLLHSCHRHFHFGLVRRIP